MSKKIVNNYTALATGIGFAYDELTNTIYGTKNGYEILIYAADQRYPYLLTISTSARSAGVVLGKDEIKLFKKSVAPASALTQKDSLITVVNKNNANQKKLCEDINFTIDALTAFLRERGFAPCCQTCGTSAQTVGFMLKSARLHLCADCAAKAKSENEVKSQERAQKSVNIIGGIIGAVLGSLIGLACIIILGQLGYVAAISGVVMAFCTLKGFDKLGGKLTKLGIVISCIIMILMTYCGNRLDWAITLSQEMKEYLDYDISVLECFKAMSAFVSQFDLSGDYLASFAQHILFVIVGAVPTIISISRDQKNINRVAQIGYMQNSGVLPTANENTDNF